MTKEEVEAKLASSKAANTKANKLKKEAEDIAKAEKARANAAERELKAHQSGGKGFGGAFKVGIKNAKDFAFPTILVGVSRGGVAVLSNKLGLPAKIATAFKTSERAAFTSAAIEQALSFAIAFLVTRTSKAMHHMSNKIVTLAVIAGSWTLVDWLIRVMGDKLLSEQG